MPIVAQSDADPLCPSAIPRGVANENLGQNAPLVMQGRSNTPALIG